MVSRELVIEVVEDRPARVDDESGLGLVQQLGVRVSDARLVPNRKHGVEHAGECVEDLLYVLGSRAEVGELGVLCLQSAEDGGVPLTV